MPEKLFALSQKPECLPFEDGLVLPVRCAPGRGDGGVLHRCCQRAPTYNMSNQAQPPSAKNVFKNSSVMT